MAIHAGSWSVGGIKLPDFGITEKLTGNRTAQGGSNLLGNQNAQGSVLGTGSQNMYNTNYSSVPYGPQYTPPDTKKINGTGTGGTSGGVSKTGFGDIGNGILNPNTTLGGGPSQIGSIDQQFNDFNSYLDSQANSAQGSFDQVKGMYDTQKQTALDQYNTDKTTQTEGIKKNESLNLAKVRQLLGDLQQGNAARTAITGGGSTSDVLAERFGRESQARLGNVMDQTQQALTRVNDFYNQSVQKLNDSYAANIQQAQQTLNDSLNQIRGAKVQNAAQKQGATVDAWKSYYDQVNQAKSAAQQFQAQYDLWKNQQDQALAAVQPFNNANAEAYNTGTASSFSDISQAQAPTQGQSAMAVNPMFRTNKKNAPEDQQYWQDQFGFTPSYNNVG